MDNGWINTADIDEELPFGGGTDEHEEPVAPENDVVGKCPVCGENVVDRSMAYFCSNCDCDFALWKDNRFLASISKEMTRDLAAELLENSQAKLDHCQSVKTGNTFNCIVKMSIDVDDRAQFSLEFPKKKRKNHSEEE